MKPTNVLSGLVAIALASVASASASASDNTAAAAIYIQPVSQSPTAPAPLAQIQYNVAAPSEAEVTSYEAPELPADAKLVRIGVYDAAAKRWASSTSVASVENFGKGYSPTVLLSVNQRGDVVSAALRGVRIDAGQTRDFGPQAVVLVSEPGKQPELNQPVVLSPEGKKVEPGEEKSMLQKYWWVIGIVVLLSLTGGGGGEGK
ncbi:Uu.00g071690.m01.CDS01 [Anthostomella pinea]|uniref:Uu.00g071690.m01.CDS01 n=1 Tax=Anthostomella pinea TaxID=933095 RepID=A0AAI8VUY0_9PEZI|nr:Uu.00g071690.m01.CDS01 [Anthostomella pinea]